MIAVLGYFLSALLATAQLVWHPVAASCPRPLWLATGVQPDGTFGCWLSHEVDDTPDTRSSASSYDGVVWWRVWCARGELAVQVGDGRGVRCARGGAGS